MMKCSSFIYTVAFFQFFNLITFYVKGNVPDYVYNYARKADLAFASENFKDAGVYYHQVLSELERTTRPENPELLHYKVRYAYAIWNDCETGKAGEIMQACRLVLDSLKEPLNRELLEVYLVLSEYYLFDNQPFNLPEKYLDRANRILNNYYPASHRYYGILYFLKGYLKYKRTDYENARQYMNQSLSIIKSYPSLIQYEYLNYSYLSAIYFYYEHNYDKAIAFCRQVTGKAVKNHQSPAFFYHIMGRSYLSLHDTVQAKACLNKAIEITSAQMNTVNNKIAYQAYFHLSVILENENQQAALLCLNNALKVAKRNSLKGREVSYINQVIGLHHFKLKNYDLALHFLQKSIIAGCYSFSDTSALNNPPPGDLRQYTFMVEVLTKKALALMYNRVNDLRHVKAALQTEELAIQLVEQWITDINDESSGLFNTELRKKTINNAVYHAALLYRHTGARFYAEKAFTYAEKSKMQVLLINTLKKQKLREAGLPDSLINRSDRLENAILNYENQIALDKKNGKSGHEHYLTAGLTRLFDERDRLYLELYEKYPAYKSIRYDYPIARLAEVQRSLTRDQAIIEYQLMDHYLITFIITRDEFRIYHQMVEKRLREEIENLRLSVSENPGQSEHGLNYMQFLAASHYLYKILIKPVREEIRGKRLIIIPSNDLSLIPFEVLIPGDLNSNVHVPYRDLPYLILENPIVYAYSASFMQDKKSQQKFGSGTAVFLPDYSERTDSVFQHLDGAEEEAAVISRIPGCRLFKGEHASEKQFRESSLNFRVMHIASHALVDEEHPNLSCLVMSPDSDTADDGFLHAFELRQLKINVQLVVLSGCNTGYGKLRLSEGLVSLARSFFYTGVRSMAFTLWSVSDKSGSELMQLFYRGLRKNEALDIAMRNAKLDFVGRADPVRAHPYFWANYVIVGKAEKVPVGKIPYAKVIMLSGFVIIISVYILRRKTNSPT